MTKKNIGVIALYILLISGLNLSAVQAQWTDNGTTLTTTDSVGIGTATPSKNLTLSSGSNLFFRIQKPQFSDYFDFGITSHVADIAYTAGTSTNSNIRFSTNGNSRFYIQHNGNIGIGTTNPSKLLHLKDGDWQQLVFDRRENTNVDDLFYIGPSYGEAGIATDGLRFSSTEDNNMLFLQASGKVGIGTLNPSNKLTVAGTVKSREVIVEENTGADFVFEDNYGLPSLSELEAFIKTNKHLPEISSAEQMKEEGVKVGELQMKLLQKIEELTLYAIEQEERLIKQQKTIEQLIQRIEQLESNKESP